MKNSDSMDSLTANVHRIAVAIIGLVVAILFFKHFGSIDAVYLDDEVGYLAKASIFNEIPLRHPSKYHFGAGIFIAPFGMIFQFESHSLAQAFLFAHMAFVFINMFLANQLLSRMKVKKQLRLPLLIISTLGPATLPFLFSQFPSILLQTITLLILLSFDEDQIFPDNAATFWLGMAKIEFLFLVGYLVHPVTMLLGAGLILTLMHFLVSRIAEKELKEISEILYSLARIPLLLAGLLFAKWLGDYGIKKANDALTRDIHLSPSGYSGVRSFIRDLFSPMSFVDALYGFFGVGLAVIACTGLALFGLRTVPVQHPTAHRNQCRFETFQARFLVWALLVFMFYGATMVNTQNHFARTDYLFYGRYVGAIIPALLLGSLARRGTVREREVLVVTAFVAVLLIGSFKFANEWILAPVNFLSFLPHIFFGEQSPGVYYGLLLLFVVLFLVAERAGDTLKLLLVITLLSTTLSSLKWVDFRETNGSAYSAHLSDLELLHDRYLEEDKVADGMPVLFIDKGGPDADLYRIRKTAGGNFELHEREFNLMDSFEEFCGVPLVLTVGGSGVDRFAEFSGFKLLLIDKYHRLAIGTPDESRCDVTSISSAAQVASLEFVDFMVFEG